MSKHPSAPLPPSLPSSATYAIVITLFLVVEIFSDGTCYPKICNSTIILVGRIFSIEILLFGMWLMVVPSIDHGNSVPDTCVCGLYRVCQSYPTDAAHLSLYTQ